MRLAILALVAACTPHGGGTAAFAVSYPDATAARAKVGARFYAKPSAHCTHEDGSDARWAITGAHVVSGELPPGVAIEDGALTGAPTKAGAYTARLEVTGVTCAGKPLADQTVDVNITVVGR